jgi:ankyrin repeat protein
MNTSKLGWSFLAAVLLLAGCVSVSRVVTPLHEAVRDGQSERAADLLREDGTDVNAQDEKGRTPLHYTATNGEAGLAEMLIAGGADVNIQDDEGNTPLHWAIRNNFAAIAEMLLENGADPSMENREGKTASDIAEEDDLRDMMDLLSRYRG